MDSFSWSDGVQAALSSCLPCFASKKQEDSSDESDNNNRTARTRQSRYDELEGLLGDVEETDVDAETMSLHSNIGRGAGQKKKKKKRNTRKKSIKLFGFDLFGRPPIQLPESEDEDGERGAFNSRRRRVGPLLSATNSNSSTSAFDSDAAPLDPASIAQLAARDRCHAAAEAERQRQEEREEREERRRRRRERRELRRKAEELASAAAMGLDDDDFEGFQGSGHGQLRSPFSAASTGSGFTSPSAPGTAVGADEYGPFVCATTFNPGIAGAGAGADDPADGEADFGGEAYAQKPRRPHGSRGSDSSRSHSVSQTSASVSNADPAQSNHHYLSQQQLLHPSSPLSAQYVSAGGPVAVGGPLAEPPRRKKKKRSTTSGSVSTGKRSNSPTSQSASLPSVDSPVDTGFGRRFNATEPYIVEHEEEHSAGFQPSVNNLAGVTLTDGSKFPSVGFGGIRRTNSAGLGAAFLARTGDD